VINGRLYRAAFAPCLIVLAIAAFSLGSQPAPLASTLAPDAFEGASAFAELQSLAARFPERRPGSVGDEALARYVARKLEGLGGPAGGGFTVRTFRSPAQTIAGERQLTTVLAERPGATDAPPILIVAHRDSAARGAQAELSGTAALLELASVLAARETKRTIVLASTSGGSGGDAGAAQLLSYVPQLAGATAVEGHQQPFDAAIVIGDVAGLNTRAPMVIPFSDRLGSAPLQLQRTVAAAISAEAGVEPGAPSTLSQLAHFAFPLSVGEQGPLNASGIPAVLVQVSSERGPLGWGASAHDALSEQRLEGFGRALLSAVDALDTGPDIPQETQSGLLLQHKVMPAWALRLLVLAALLPAAFAAVDGLARARRRRLAVGRCALWTLSCALPFLICAVFAYVLGWLGILGATPGTPTLPSALPVDGRALTAIVALALTFALAWLLWVALVRRLRWEIRADPEAAGIPLVLLLLGLAFVAWLANPFTALLALPAVHAWLALAEPDRLELDPRVRRIALLTLVLVGVLPLVLLIGFYSSQLGLGLGGTAWMGTLLLAGGYVSFGSALLWSIAFGCAAAGLLLAFGTTRPRPADERRLGGIEVTIRGPLSYAGPGSLGGTESALRR
jgi:hypothetical protein